MVPALQALKFVEAPVLGPSAQAFTLRAFSPEAWDDRHGKVFP